MTAQPQSSSPQRRPREGPFLGLGTVIRQGIDLVGPRAEGHTTPWAAVLGAIFMTLIPFIAEATKEASSAGLLSHDPTTNVLLGWTGADGRGHRHPGDDGARVDRARPGHTRPTLTNPVSPTSVISAKFVVAFAIFVATAILLPMLVSIGLATVVYGGLPDLCVIGIFLVLFRRCPRSTSR